MAAWSARRDPGVCRTRVGGPGKVRHAPLRGWPRHPGGSPVSAAWGGLAMSIVQAAPETTTGVPVSRSSSRWTLGVMCPGIVSGRDQCGQAEQVGPFGP